MHARVYLHVHAFPESYIPQIWPEKFRTPQKIAHQFSHPVASWMNYLTSFHTPVLDIYGFHTPGSQQLQFSYPGQFPCSLVPDIKNDRFLRYVNSAFLCSF